MSVRCSSLPRFIECASSELRPPDEPQFDPVFEEGRLGDAVHEALAAMVDGKHPDLVALARLYEVDPKELGRLYAYGRKAWSELKRYFPRPQTEVPVEGPVSKGTTDLMHHDQKTGVVLDWKSGRVRRSGTYQVMGYASCVRNEFGMPESGVITTIVVWLQYGEFEVFNMRTEDLSHFEASVHEHHKKKGRQYGPGEYCTFCVRRLACPARRDFMRQSIALLPADPKEALTREQLGPLYPRARALEALLEDYFRAVRMALEDGGGPIPLGDGRAVKLGPNTRYRIDVRKAWPILKAHGFDDVEINQVLRASKQKIGDIVREKAPTNHKTKAQNGLFEELQESDAMHVIKTTKLQIVKEKTT